MVATEFDVRPAEEWMKMFAAEIELSTTNPVE